MSLNTENSRPKICCVLPWVTAKPPSKGGWGWLVQSPTILPVSRFEKEHHIKVFQYQPIRPVLAKSHSGPKQSALKHDYYVLGYLLAGFYMRGSNILIYVRFGSKEQTTRSNLSNRIFSPRSVRIIRAAPLTGVQIDARVGRVLALRKSRSRHEF